jgi:hypothetical protein
MSVVDVTSQLNNLNKARLSKYQPITEMYDSVTAFKVKLRLWKTSLKLHHLLHIPHVKYLDIVYLSVFKNFPSPLFCFKKTWTKRFQDFKIIEPELPLFA